MCWANLVRNHPYSPWWKPACRAFPFHTCLFSGFLPSPRSVRCSPLIFGRPACHPLLGPHTSWKTVVQKMIACVRPWPSKWSKTHWFDFHINFRRVHVECIMCVRVGGVVVQAGEVNEASFPCCSRETLPKSLLKMLFEFRCFCAWDSGFCIVGAIGFVHLSYNLLSSVFITPWESQIAHHGVT